MKHTVLLLLIAIMLSWCAREAVIAGKQAKLDAEAKPISPYKFENKCPTCGAVYGGTN